jgi:hypothetical protein
MVHSSPVEDVENSTRSLRVDGSSVRKRVSYQEMFRGHTVAVKRVLQDPLHHPL